MSFSKVYSAQTSLLDAYQIDIETDISRGLNQFTIVGLGDKAIEESKDRVSAAIKNSGFLSPKQRNQKVVISLAPAHIRKNGVLFDVAIALSYLKAVEDINFDSEKNLFLGELALNGVIRKVHGVLPLVRFAKQNGFTSIFVPKENAEEAAVVSGINIYPIENLEQVIEHLQTSNKIKPQKQTKISQNDGECLINMSDIRGQEHAKRALTIAAAGRHNIALSGPPGTGKTLLAKAFTYILPTLSFEEMLDVTSIHSIANILDEPIIKTPPIRSPHHTASYAAVFGGGMRIKPGEITLAHKGVLFLDEFPEFEKKIIEGLRQPLEDKYINISRADGTVRYPADFILIVTLNPCPCGFLNSQIKQCSCSQNQVANYQHKMSGPIVDRIDMWIDVPHIEHSKILEKRNFKNNQSLNLLNQISKARSIQSDRYIQSAISTNGELSSKDIDKYINLTDSMKNILINSAKKFNLSIRSTHKIIKLSQTIADLDHSSEIKDCHLLEALQYRPKI